MAACGSLQHIFENKLLPENPTLIESLSWNQIKPVVVNPLEHQQHSFTEIFGELHFKETTLISSSSNYTKLNQNNNEDFGESSNNKSRRHKSSDSFSSWSSESLQLCTEGLGFESSYDVEDMMKSHESGEKEYCVENHAAAQVSEEYNDCYGGGGGEHWRRSSRMSSGGGNSYPPPISSIGRSGKPGVLFRSFRSNGRFVLEEIRVPSQEFLHASREDGRLKLHFIHPDDDDDDDDDEFLEEEEEEDVDEEQEEEE
ncbi:hypothetical protein HN51_043091 [Arachis hypogaea]|uniref:FAF domain-containing protein n=1 Tax=Arachis hypogaea TaxID=3818 RepID=A0A444Y7A7_ARAHY|nr:protein FAF-like, chloroplastic [Arachis ipaensis]XP_025673144.1 protein FAF-like, chloroplastic [Arachis hypogaea]QHN95214.1 Protein FAF-like [Arachis hypogaea]RYQ97809.1 hypothetical protein Ahy_B08g093886 [Arachis hypogaea]